MRCVQWAQTVQRAACAINDAAQQLCTDRQMARSIARPAAGMIHSARARQGMNDFHREYPTARNDALDIALRHQKQPVVFKPHHFGLNERSVGKRDSARAAHGQFHANRFHDEACHPSYPARYLQRFGNGEQFAAVAQIGLPARYGRGRLQVYSSPLPSFPSEAAIRCQRLCAPAST